MKVRGWVFSESRFLPREICLSSIAIEVRNLVKVYQKRGQPAVRALDGISFDVPAGRIFGLLGPNGAGKTTTLKILTTLLPATSGSASILGFDVAKHPLEVRKNICVVLQENAADLHLSLRDNLRTYGRFHGLSSHETEFHASRVTELFDLGEHRNQKLIDLSGGLKRRLQVAKVFMVDKQVVFLDEATTGMDAINKRTTIQAIKQEARRGRTIILTTHILAEAEELCDSLIIVDRGRIAASGSVEDVKSIGMKFVHVTMMFRRLNPRTISALKRFSPVSIETKNTSVDLTLQKESDVLKVLRAAKKDKHFVSFEVSGATLEDVFVELVRLPEKESR